MIMCRVICQIHLKYKDYCCFVFRMKILGLLLASPKHFKSHQTISSRYFQTLVTSTWLKNQLGGASANSNLRVLDASWQSNGQGYEQLYKQ